MKTEWEGGRCGKPELMSHFFLLETTTDKRSRGIAVSAILLYAYTDNL